MILLVTILILLILGGYEAIILAIELTILGIIGQYLYHMKAEKKLYFYVVKVPLNIIFNIFLFILLLKSWSMREFKGDFEQLDKRSFRGTT